MGGNERGFESMMTKILLNLAVVFTVLCLSCEAAAQSDIALATRNAELQALSVKLKKRDENDRRQVQEFARRTGTPLRRELPNGRVLELQRISRTSARFSILLTT